MLDRDTLVGLSEADPEEVSDHWECLQEVIATALELYSPEGPEILPPDSAQDPILGDDGYPTEIELYRIKTWDPRDLVGLFLYLRERWYHQPHAWRQLDNLFSVSTAGWSGNEDLVAALQANRPAWALTWRQSRRGGHYEFEIPKEMFE